MKIVRKEIKITSEKQIEFIDVTDQVQEVIDNSGIREGQVLIYMPHTTMGVAINHNEPMLLQDFARMLYKIAPIDDQYSHDLFELKKSSQSDGRSNGHSHCKQVLIGGSQTVPIEKGKMILTERQSIFAVEFDGSRQRNFFVQVMGE